MKYKLDVNSNLWKGGGGGLWCCGRAEALFSVLLLDGAAFFGAGGWSERLSGRFPCINSWYSSAEYTNTRIEQAVAYIVHITQYARNKARTLHCKKTPTNSTGAPQYHIPHRERSSHIVNITPS